MLTFELPILIGLLLLSGFFSSAETALTAITKQQMQILKKKKPKGLKYLQEVRKNPGSMLATILIANNVVNIALTSLATIVIIDLLGQYKIINNTYATLITTVIVTLFVLVFGEVTPKTVALARTKMLALFVAPVIRTLSYILSPIVYVLSKISSVCVKLVGGQPLEKGALVSEEEILALIEAGEDSGAIEKEEEIMLHDVIKFGDTLVKSVMTPMDEVMSIEENADLNQIIKVIKKRPHSRLPVYRQFRTNIKGVLYLKDLFLLVAQSEEQNIELSKTHGLIRKPFVVLIDQKVSDVLKRMRAKRIHIAIVNNRDRKTVGIITIEDLIEEIVGEIEDEYEGK